MDYIESLSLLIFAHFSPKREPRPLLKHSPQLEQKPRLTTAEFVPMMALVISLTAMAIDAMLPALPAIARDLGATGANQGQLVVSLMFTGFALGQLFYGPLSDSIGRLPSIYLGTALFVLGSALAMSAQTFAMMLAGRVLQGLGAAGPRIISAALIRDQYEGTAMAKLMSLIMGIFVLVPAIAPSLGQLVMDIGHWRWIFGMLILQAALATGWLALRQPETLPSQYRRRLSPRSIGRNVMEVLRTPTTMAYTMAAGFIFAGFIGFLSSAPQIFADLFGIVRDFPLYFAALATSVGVASILNSRIVMRVGMHRLATLALIGLFALGAAFGFYVHAIGGEPTLGPFMAYLLGSFFFVGILMGNLNAMAMQPLGHLAGTGAAVVGAVSLAISLVGGTYIGQSYSGTVLPLVTGFTVAAFLSLLVGLILRLTRKLSSPPAH